MRIDRRFAIVVGLSLIWAFLVSTAFYRVAGSGGGRQPRGPQPQRPLVVAVEPMPIGAVIKPTSVKLSGVPENFFPNGGFSRIEDVLERPVISPIQPDEPIIEARIATRGSGGGLSPLIPPGLRAISVRVNDVVGVAGFVLPGMRVDVLVTGRPPGHEGTMTATVLQNITVLSAGQTIQVDAKSQAINTPVVTLLVTPAQAEVLTLANSEGRIQLILRNSSDQQVAATAGRELRELYGLARQETAPPPTPAVRYRPAPTPPPGPTPPAAVPRLLEAPSEGIVVIRGNQKVIESFEPSAGGSK
jgi:pilus assembly protein CpaB